MHIKDKNCNNMCLLIRTKIRPIHNIENNNLIIYLYAITRNSLTNRPVMPRIRKELKLYKYLFVRNGGTGLCWCEFDSNF